MRLGNDYQDGDAPADGTTAARRLGDDAGRILRTAREISGRSAGDEPPTVDELDRLVVAVRDLQRRVVVVATSGTPDVLPALRSARRSINDALLITLGLLDDMAPH